MADISTVIVLDPKLDKQLVEVPVEELSLTQALAKVQDAINRIQQMGYQVISCTFAQHTTGGGINKPLEHEAAYVLLVDGSGGERDARGGEYPL